MVTKEPTFLFQTCPRMDNEKLEICGKPRKRSFTRKGNFCCWRNQQDNSSANLCNKTMVLLSEFKKNTSLHKMKSLTFRWICPSEKSTLTYPQRRICGRGKLVFRCNIHYTHNTYIHLFVCWDENTQHEAKVGHPSQLHTQIIITRSWVVNPLLQISISERSATRSPLF
jgi:hypothetical protein